MSHPATPLPEFGLPPVIEVVCGVQFEPLESLLSVHYGAFWQLVKDEYPRIEERAPLDDIRETEQGTTVRAELIPMEMPPLRRVFLIDASGNFLLQVQPARFLSNWRKERAEDEYPRYSTAWKRFQHGWNAFVDFAKSTGLGVPRANQYELTYINHVPESEEPYPVGIEHYLPLFAWKSAQSIKFLPAPRSASLRLAFSLLDKKGRLHLTANHGQRTADGKGVLVMDLTARGQAKADWSDMEEWFSLAHEWIVRGFTDLTSPAAHEAWRRIR